MNGRRLIPAFAAALLIVVPQATARPSGASCGHGTRALAAARALTMYDDDIEDASGGPDFCGGEIVTNDNNTVTIGIHVHNRDGFGPGDHYTALIDTNPAVSGPEYELAFDGSGVQLERWTGSESAPVTADVRMMWLDGYGPALNVERADIGNPSAFGLVLVSTDGTNGDRAPDTGSWPYSVTPLELKMRSLKLGKARAGRTLVAQAVVWRNDWDIALDDGRIGCSAQLGHQRLTGRGTFTHGHVNCRWRLPANAAGKRLSGLVAVTYQGATAARSFSLRVA